MTISKQEYYLYYCLPHIWAVCCCGENIKLIVRFEIFLKVWIAINVFKISEIIKNNYKMNMQY